MCLFVEVITVSIKGQMIFPSTEEIANPRFCQAHEVCFDLRDVTKAADVYGKCISCLHVGLPS